jgi:Spy/CpxP family protein refolding chaperone
MQIFNRILAKTLMGLALTAAIAGTAFAAESTHREHRDPLARLQAKLNLNDDQVSQLRPTFDAMREERKSERGQFRAELQSVLTADQLARLDAEHQQGERHGMRDLGLSPDQQQQLKSYWAQARPQMRTERHQMTAQIMAVLTPDQQARYKAMLRHWRNHHNARMNNAG